MAGQSHLIHSLRPGVDDAIQNTWKKEFYETQGIREALFRQLPIGEKDARQMIYSFKSPVPFPNLWRYGYGRTYSGIKDYITQIHLYKYQLAITWSRDDENDDLIGDLRQQAQTGVGRFFQLQDVLLAEYLNGAASLNPSLGTSWTGTSIFNTVDGNGDDLYGVSGGNIISGSGTTEADVHQDIFTIQRRAARMVDPIAQKPLYSYKEIRTENMLCIIPPELNETFTVAAESKFFKRSSDNNTSESNVLQNKFEWVLNPYLTDTNDWFVVIKHDIWKPFLLRAPGSVRTFMADESNSDRARDTAELGIYMDVRLAVHPYMQCSIFKVSNT